MDFTAEQLIDSLSSKLNIRVLGPCFPLHDEPIQCFTPLYRSYQHNPTTAHSPYASTETSDGMGCPRLVDQADSADRPIFVFDRDVVSTWRLPNAMAAYEVYFWEKTFEWALGQETMLVAIEAFLDSGCEIGDYSLSAFAGFLRTLDTQPVTVTLSSLVRDMLESYRNVTRGLEEFSWAGEVESAVREFVAGQECLFFGSNHAPVVRATFCVTGQRRDELDVDLRFAWNPPLIAFRDLHNVVSEGDRFVFKPALSGLSPNQRGKITEEYLVESNDDWLQWDEQYGGFRGVVPRHLAAQVGAERLDKYTTPLELTCHVTKPYPGGMRFERIIRCALPLTIKRKAATCAETVQKILSPPQRPLLRPRLHATFPRRQRKSSPRFNEPSASQPWGKENEELSTEEVSKLLKLKAGSTDIASPPHQLDSYSLARFHHVAASLQSPSSNRLGSVEIRTLPSISPNDQGSVIRRTLTSRGQSRHTEEQKVVDLGSTHIDRRGNLASQSDSDKENDSEAPTILSTPAKEITPPPASLSLHSSPVRGPRSAQKVGGPSFGRDIQRSPGDHQSREKKPFCFRCLLRGERARVEESNVDTRCGVCGERSTRRRDHDTPTKRAQDNEIETISLKAARTQREDDSNNNEIPAMTLPFPPHVLEHGRRTTDDWQAEIRRNFQEFEDHRLEPQSTTRDVTLEDVADSDEELSLWNSTSEL